LKRLPQIPCLNSLSCFRITTDKDQIGFLLCSCGPDPSPDLLSKAAAMNHPLPLMKFSCPKYSSIMIKR